MASFQSNSDFVSHVTPAHLAFDYQPSRALNFVNGRSKGGLSLWHNILAGDGKTYDYNTLQFPLCQISSCLMDYPWRVKLEWLQSVILKGDTVMSKSDNILFHSSRLV